MRNSTRTLFFLLSAWFLALPSSSFAAREVPFKLVGACGGRVECIASKGRYSYIAQGPMVRIADSTNPASPRQVGSLLFNEPVRDLAIRGRALYVVNNTAHGCWLRVFDIANPIHPRPRRTFEFPHPDYDAINIKVFGHFLWVMSGTYHQYVDRTYDITDPLNPVRRRVQRCGHSDDWNEELSIRGNIAYVNERDKLIIRDNAKPAPTQIAEIKITDYMEDLLASDSALYIMTSNGIRVFDISHPRNPVEKRIVKLEREGEPKRYMTITGSVLWVWLEDRYPFLEAVYDVSNPLRPVPHPTIKPEVHPDEDSVQRSIPAVSASPAWLEDIGYFNDIQTSGRFAFLAAGPGLAVLDITDPAQCRLLGECEIRGEQHFFALDGHTVCAGGSHPFIELVDVSRPTSPTLCGSIELPEPPLAMAVADHKLYVADGSAGLLVIDIADPKAPKIISTCAMSHSCTSVAVVGHFAYAAAFTLHVIDISTPAHPLVLKELTAGFPINLHTNGKTLYACGEYAETGMYYGDEEDDTQIGCAVLDVTNPSAPRLLPERPLFKGARLALGDGIMATAAYGKTGPYGVYDEGIINLYDVSKPAKPTQIGSIRPPVGPSQVFLRGDTMFVASARGLMMIYRRQR